MKSRALWIVPKKRLPAIRRSSSSQNSNRKSTEKRRWHDTIPIGRVLYSRTAPSCLPARRKQCAQTQERAKLPCSQHESYTDFSDYYCGKLLVWLVHARSYCSVEKNANSCLDCDKAMVASPPRYSPTSWVPELTVSERSIFLCCTNKVWSRKFHFSDQTTCETHVGSLFNTLGSRIPSSAMLMSCDEWNWYHVIWLSVDLYGDLLASKAYN